MRFLSVSLQHSNIIGTSQVDSAADMMAQPQAIPTEALEKGASVKLSHSEALPQKKTDYDSDNNSNNNNDADADADAGDNSNGNSKQHGSPSRSSWRHLFVFTQRRHAVFLSSAVITALLVAVTKTVYSILLGKIIDIVSPLGAGSVSAEAAMGGVRKWCLVLVGVGVAVWAFNSAFMALWIIFGELEARSARETLFSNLLYKEMAWFDSQEEGVSSALSRMQM